MHAHTHTRMHYQIERHTAKEQEGTAADEKRKMRKSLRDAGVIWNWYFENG